MTLHRSFLATAAAAALAALTLSPAIAQDAAPEAEAAQDQAEAPEGRVLDDIALGDESAPVTFIEYASFTCNHCANFHTSTFGDLKSEYIDTGKVRFIQRDVYFDAVGLWAGVLARCGGDDDRYYAVSDLLFTEQSAWLSGNSGDEIAGNLRRMGARTGLTGEQMDACWNDQQLVSDLVTTFQHHAGADQIEGTPTFIINGEKVSNQPWNSLKEIIDAKLTEAEAE